MSIGVELVPLSFLIAAAFSGGYSLFELKNRADKKRESNSVAKNIIEIPSYILPTVFADEDTLIQSLNNLGLCYTKKNGAIETNIQNCSVKFYKESDSYNMQITGNIDMDEVWEEYTKITDDYGKVVQSKVIQNIKEKVSQSNSFSIEDEVIEEDDTVVITINI